MNDETIFDTNEVKNEPQNNEAMNNNEPAVDEQQASTPESAPKEKKKRDYKTAGLAGAAGVAGAAIGVLTPVNLFPEAPDSGEDISIDEETETTEPAPSASGHLQGHDMEVATGVNDSMSFNQAFAAARHEVGPGGLFTWHGHTYGTYYANEWNAMSPEDKDQYWADVYHTTSHIEHEPQTHQDSHDVDNNVQSDNNNHEDDNNNHDDDNNNHDDDNNSHDDDNNNQNETIDQNEINNQNETNDQEEINTTVNGETDTNDLNPIEENQDDNGQVEVEIGEVQQQEEIIVDQEADSQDGVLILDESQVQEELDLNDDGMIDTLVVDVNHNDIPDLVLDVTGEGDMDTLVVDAIDENGDLIIDENNVSELDVFYTVPDDESDGLMEEADTDNPDVDEFASLTPDPDITIDNDMDMSDFA